MGTVKEHRQSTMGSWCLILFFSTITSTSLTMLYIEEHRNPELMAGVTYKIYGTWMSYRNNPWVPAQIFCWSTTIFAALSITINAVYTLMSYCSFGIVWRGCCYFRL